MYVQGRLRRAYGNIGLDARKPAFGVSEKVILKPAQLQRCVHLYACTLTYLDMGLDARKPVFGGLANNNGADQLAHPRSLISAFAIRILESFICRLGTGEISIF